MSTTTHGNNIYYFKIPYTEVMHGHLTVSVSADTEKEAVVALMHQDWAVMEEHDYDIHDSEIVDLYWKDHDLTQIVCNQCGADIHWSETQCECVEGWNDPDVTTPDRLYGVSA